MLTFRFPDNKALTNSLTQDFLAAARTAAKSPTLTEFRLMPDGCKWMVRRVGFMVEVHSSHRAVYGCRHPEAV